MRLGTQIVDLSADLEKLHIQTRLVREIPKLGDVIEAVGSVA